MKITKRQLRNLVRESIIKEMKPFRMPDSYYDPPDGEEIPDELYDDMEDIFERAARSPNKKYTFVGPDGDYTLVDETDAGGDILPAYLLIDPKGEEEQFDIESKEEMGRLEEMIIDLLYQNFKEQQGDY